MYACLSGHLSGCLWVLMFVCASILKSILLDFCMYVYFDVHLNVWMSGCLDFSMFVSVYFCLSVCLDVCLLLFLPV